MNKIVVALFALLACASISVNAHTCGTPQPTRGFVDANGRTTAACYSDHPCDNPATRDSYILNKDSTVLKMRVNSIFFGDLTNNTTNKENYDTNMEFFVRRYRELLGIELIINTTEVTTEYQAVDSGADATHLEMAQKYYKPGWMTVMYADFNPNSAGLLGYASTFPNTLPETIGDWYTIMSIYSLFSNGTTVHHEVGHMLGLYHVFIQDCADTACSEGVASENRNLVGDLCNDTMPMQVDNQCQGELTTPNDCTNTPILETFTYESLPWNNFMAYTDDNCQVLGFTPQQSGRARCFLSTTLSFLTPEPPKPPVDSGNSPSAQTPAQTPDQTPAGRVSSATQLAAVGLASLAMALTL